MESGNGTQCVTSGTHREQLRGGATDSGAVPTSSRGDSPSSLPLNDVAGRVNQERGDVIVHVPLTTPSRLGLPHYIVDDITCSRVASGNANQL
jgi:hypothetical protein